MGVSVSGRYLFRTYLISFLRIFHSPDRWDNLPESASELPGLFSNTLTFSAGPRVSSDHLLHVALLTVRLESCIGLRFSMIEIKTFLYLLLTNFKFQPTEDKILKANVYAPLFEHSQIQLTIL